MREVKTHLNISGITAVIFSAVFILTWIVFQPTEAFG
jgi:uncharacterized membrane protein YciS (DUF1049 family)